MPGNGISKNEDCFLVKTHKGVTVILKSDNRQLQNLVSYTAERYEAYKQAFRLPQKLVGMPLLCVYRGLPLMGSGAQAALSAPSQQDWPQYLHDLQNTAASNETILSTSNVAKLSKRWTFQTGGNIAAGAAVVGNTVYIGSWDGYEYALDLTTGTQKWKTFLGKSVNSACNPPTIGVTSSAEVLNGVVYVGGGDSNWYALDSATGKVLWTVPTGDNSAAGGHYNWSSPLIYNGFAYI